MKKICLAVIIVVLLGTGVPFNGWADELVRGWYDTANDWFVFQWEREGEGTITSYLDPSNKVEPVIETNVAHDKNASEYVYSYTVTNKGGIQPIFTILIKYDAAETTIYNASVPTQEWSTAENKMEAAWDWAKTGGEINGIPPGETVKGFSFGSKGIPAITNAVFYGHNSIEDLFYGQEGIAFGPPGDFDTFETMYSYERVSDKLQEQYPDKFKDVVLKTIGPTAPPEELVPSDFLQSIIEMKHEAFEQGWIDNKGIEQSLDQKLEAARKKLQSGDTKAACNILGAFVNEVEAQGCSSYEGCPKGKHLTPEAYALLKYNAEYLIDNLK